MPPDTPPPAKRPFAAALHYELGTLTLPSVTAKGYGTVAEQIIALAIANGVKVHQDENLAALLSVIEVDSEIPVEALVAVAEILSYIYKAKSAASQRPQG